MVFPSSQVSSQPCLLSPQRQTCTKPFSRTAPGPVMPPTRLIDVLAVAGTQNSATVSGRDASFAQKSSVSLVQSALLVHALFSNAQYLPSGDGTPVRVMRVSKHGRFEISQTPPSLSWHVVLPAAQFRYGLVEHSPWVVVAQASSTRSPPTTLPPQMFLSLLQSFGFCCAKFCDCSPPVPTLQAWPFGQSPSSKHGRSGLSLQKPQLHQ